MRSLFLRAFALVLLSVFVFGFFGCSIKKYVQPPNYLLSKVKVTGAPSQYNPEIYGLLKQKPNKKIIGLFRLNMWFYLKATEKKILKKKEDKLKRDLWEEPVLLDSNLTSASANQINGYLFNKGLFHNRVIFSVKTASTFRNALNKTLGIKHYRSAKARVTYHVTQGDQFYIKKLDYYIFDKHIADLVFHDSTNRLVHSGDIYDGDKLSAERDRITYLLRDNGYYNFSREYIYFEIDSTLPGNVVNAGIGISNPSDRTRHRIYKNRNIIIDQEYTYGDTAHKDTVDFQDLKFVEKPKPRVKELVLSRCIYFRKDSLYRAANYQVTLNRLSQLDLFKTIDIQLQPDTISNPDTGYVDCLIRLTPAKKREISAEIELNSREESQAQFPTSTYRSVGTSGSLLYRNRNVFKRGVLLEIRPRAAIELPVTVLQNNKVIDTPSYEYGLTNSLIFPRLLLPGKIKVQDRNLTTQSSVNLNLIYEKNRFYRRTTVNTNLTYQINKSNKRYFITPIEISLVNTNFISSSFEARVKDRHDPLLLNLFDQHLLTDARFTFMINQQPLTTVIRRYWYFRNTIESGGNLAWLLDELGNKKDTGTNRNLTHELYGIRYFQYARNEATIAYYLPVWHDYNLAVRGIVGLGLPYGNSTILPFEKRFYVGGANSLRAWRLRQLGPGSYRDTTNLHFDQSGDIRLEGNAELRFPIYGILKGALFADAGNIWLYKFDSLRRGANFGYDSFYREFAVDAGIGTRFDFNFFVVRLDFAIPLRDPSFPEHERWIAKENFGPDWYTRIVINLGIGYPF